MIRFDNVSITYPGGERPVLDHVDLTIGEGELCLLTGRTGTGKSTMLGAVNGLVPHFTGGHLDGEVTVDGIATSTRPPREFAHLVGVVGQDPLAGFVTDTVEEELAYGMEQLAVPPATMRKRVEETLDLLGIAELRRRPLRTLSGGQQQRVAIGSVLTSHPRVLVLDEPTSALDPTAAEDVLAAITRLVHDLGVTVLMAEHRMERVVQYADRLIHLPGDGTAQYGEPADILRTSTIAPPIVELGRLAGWDPLPLSVRDARRVAGPLRERLAGATPSDTPANSSLPAGRSIAASQLRAASTTPTLTPPAATPAPTSPSHAHPTSPRLLSARKVVVRYVEVVAVRGVDLELHRGVVTALMGRNGSGKSSLLWGLHGAGPRQGGSVDVDGNDPKKLSRSESRKLVGLVPQTPSDLLYRESVAEECAGADKESGAASGTCRGLLDRIVPGLPDKRHPRDLSEGQRLSLALAIQLTAAPAVVLLDEPTRGLDYSAKARLRDIVRDLAADGRTVVVATHDVEFVAMTADRVVVMAEGEIVADGTTTEVVSASPAFAPQVAKILAPSPWLTVDAVRHALEMTR